MAGKRKTFYKAQRGEYGETVLLRKRRVHMPDGYSESADEAYASLLREEGVGEGASIDSTPNEEASPAADQGHDMPNEDHSTEDPEVRRVDDDEPQEKAVPDESQKSSGTKHGKPNENDDDATDALDQGRFFVVGHVVGTTVPGPNEPGPACIVTLKRVGRNYTVFEVQEMTKKGGVAEITMVSGHILRKGTVRFTWKGAKKVHPRARRWVEHLLSNPDLRARYNSRMALLRELESA